MLRQATQATLLAKIHDDHCGVEYLITGTFRSPIAPMRASHAAVIADADREHWTRRWAHYFATALHAAQHSPLYDGRWLLNAHPTRLEYTPWARSVAQRWAELLLTDNPGEIDWFSRQGGWQVLPLRQLSDPTDGRVKAYRKQATAGILPPVLLWWISSLDCYVILDGHDRILAAIAEEQEPSFMALANTNRQRIGSHSQAVVDRYLAEQQLIPSTATGALAASSRRLARTLNEIDTDYDRTRAWMLPGGSAAWDAVAQARDSAWSDYIDQLIADELRLPRRAGPSGPSGGNSVPPRNFTGTEGDGRADPAPALGERQESALSVQARIPRKKTRIGS
ncbi:hypothetical protein [Actinoplanes regularis]|uniref:Uncharacterized protein n=1 Tax=Actinoplanes regularis TaxID=52697 RepID=A0A239KCH9_9ACTN|nr:hypothetical protein [Actinoplanes regularis]SNT14824.1 hypothetical protein SAMN06264365_1461 [Actinoplanes regularis]